MRLKLAGVAMALAVLAATSCSSDPAVKMQRYRDSGDRYAASKKYSEAIIQYRNALALAPRDGQIRFKLGNALLGVGDALPALTEFMRAADLLPMDIPVQQRAGELLLLAQQFPEARAKAEAILEIDPKNRDGLILMGNALAGLKEFDQAVIQLEQAIESDPRRILTYQNLGVLQFIKGEKGAAEGVFKRAVELQPQSAAAHGSLANYYWAAGRLPEAETELKNAYALDPKSPVILQTLAAFYSSDNRPEEAESYLKKYVDVTGDVGSRITLADFYLLRGQVKDALPQLDAVSKTKDGFVTAMTRLAAIAYDDGRSQEAHQKIDAALQRESKNVAALVMKARFLLHEGKSSDAMTFVNKAIEENPRSVVALMLKGSIFDKRGETTEAIAALQEALKQAPGSREAQLRLARLYLSQRDFGPAASLGAQLVKSEPGLTVARLIVAQAALGQGNLKVAESELAVVAKVDPKSAQFLSTSGDLYRLQNQAARARAAYSAALQRQPDLVSAITGLVELDLEEKKADAARSRVAAAVNSNPDDSAVLTLAGVTYSATGDSAEAEAALKRAVELNPANFPAYSKLANLYLHQGRLDEAIRNYEDLAKRRPAFAVGAITMMGIIYELQQKPAEARKAYEKVLGLDQRAPVAANNLAFAYAESGENLDLALQLAQTAKSQMPQNAEVSDTLGWVYLKKGLAPLAITAFREGTEQDKSSATLRYHLGLAYLQDGQKDRARQVIEQALKLNPKFAEAEAARRDLASL